MRGSAPANVNAACSPALRAALSASVRARPFARGPFNRRKRRRPARRRRSRRHGRGPAGARRRVTPVSAMSSSSPRIAGLVDQAARQPVAPLEALVGDRKHVARHILHRPSGGGGVQRQTRHVADQRRAIFHRPMLAQIPRRRLRRGIVQYARPQRRQGAKPRPRPGVGAAHLQVLLQPHLGKDRAGVVDPVLDRRLVARNLGQPAGHERGKRPAGDVDVAALALDEIHRHLERVAGIGLEAEAVLEHEVQHSRAIFVGVGPTRRRGRKGSRWAALR